MHGVIPVCEASGGDLAMTLVRSLYETMISAYWMSIVAIAAMGGAGIEPATPGL